ncbi:MAG: alanine racemase [Clostridia bacterium]|nr:alanine racemase [Clostridia bacterium]
MKSFYKDMAGQTPAYVFDIDAFSARIKTVAKKLGTIPLCYSIKANPFLTGCVPAEITHLEVCSLGELKICESLNVDMSKIIFSGVNKTAEAVQLAMNDSVGIFTAESKLHLKIINDCAVKCGKKVKLILRLSCGNQFGMDESDIKDIISDKEKFDGVEIIGIHYYCGTQKKKAVFIEKELASLQKFLVSLKDELNFEPSMVEYGAGMASDYFGEEPEKNDMDLLNEVAPLLIDFSKKYPLSVEMGRFFASDCGTYFTKIEDTKVIHEINYAICDGGIHHLKYYGQTMAMQVPPIEVLNPVDEREKFWSICGSLCTTADVLVRKASLKGAGIGSVLVFERCGAYSVTEGSALFLSHALPKIYLYSESTDLVMVRDIVETYELNKAK